ncbi:MAG: TIM barrel protein [Candidatus Brocadiaceae bacterium]|nr:TIM barrel protein [Candidatus Brocadiaceae bacterium]
MIGLSTSYYASKGYSIYESVSRTVELGFDLVEMGAAHDYEENAFDTLRKIKKDFGSINFTIHTLFPPLEKKVWFNPADGLTEVNKEIVEGLFKSASILEASFVSIHPLVFSKLTMGKKIVGNFYRPVPNKQKDPIKSKDNFICLMEYISDLTKTTGVKVLIENMGDSFFHSYPLNRDDYIEVFKQFSSAGMLLDVAHAKQQGNLCDLISLDGRICELHLHDIRTLPDGEVRGHFPIENIAYFEPLKDLMKRDSLIFVFEHSSDCSEDAISRDKDLLEKVLEGL